MQLIQASSIWRKVQLKPWRMRLRWARRCVSAATIWRKASSFISALGFRGTARVVLSAREMGRILHAKGVERLVRNDLWKGRTPERYYDSLEWIYAWNVAGCLAGAYDA